MDIGESLVGAYMRHIRACDVVTYNTFLRGEQGELDVVAMRLAEPRTVWFCEVTTHIRGMAYGKGNRETVARLHRKLDRARAFARITYPDVDHRFEVWSPYVPVGKLTTRFATLAREWSVEDLSLTFVINETFTERVRELVEHARSNPSTTNEPAYRMLQVLTRLRGGAMSV